MILMKIPGGQLLARILRFAANFAPGLALGFILPADSHASENPSPVVATSRKISYYHDIRPILQANCQGCHQPAKSKGGYVMTDFKKLLAGGDSAHAAIVPEHPEQSSILKMITPQDGEVRMPKGKPPSEMTKWHCSGPGLSKAPTMIRRPTRKSIMTSSTRRFTRGRR